MANFLDKFLDSMKLYDEDEENEEDNFGLKDEEEEKAAAKPSIFNKFNFKKEEPQEEEDDYTPSRTAAAPARTGSAYTRTSAPSSASVRGTRTGAPAMEVCMVRPSSMEDARDICELLLDGRAVVINMEGVQVELAQRIIDFSSGACYSLSGNLQKISNSIFILTPSNIQLSGDFQNVLAGTKSVSGLSSELGGMRYNE